MYFLYISKPQSHLPMQGKKKKYSARQQFSAFPLLALEFLCKGYAQMRPTFSYLKYKGLYCSMLHQYCYENLISPTFFSP